MKIAHIASPWQHIPFTHYEGTYHVLSDLIEAQIEQGHEVTLIAPGDSQTSAQLVSYLPQALQDEGIPWHIHRKAYYHLSKAIEYIQNQTFDIVHAHMVNTADLYLFPLLSELTTPHLLTLHDRFPQDQGIDAQEIVQQYAQEWGSTTPIFATSRNAMIHQGATFHIPITDSVYHGIGRQYLQPVISSPQPYTIWIGQYTPEDGAHIAIEAALKAETPLILSGTLPKISNITSNSDNLRYYQECIKPALDGRMIRTCSPLNRYQQFRLLHNASCLLHLATWEEPFNMTPVTALAVGCPVITLPYGGIQEIIEPEQTGFCVKDSTELATAIKQCQTLDREHVQAQSQTYWSAEAMAQRYLHIYQQAFVHHHTSSY